MKTNLKLLFLSLFIACGTLAMQPEHISPKRVNFPSQEPLKEPISWGIFERQGMRDHFEDTYAAGTLGLLPWATARYFAIFDGHDGDQAAKYAAANLFNYFNEAYQAHLEKTSTIQDDIQLSLKSAITRLDQEIQSKYERSGTTAIIALILGDECYLAWVGDSRAVVADKMGGIKASTIDHNPQRFEEKTRITKAGERVTMQNSLCGPIFRVSNGLAMSRSIGDRCFKQQIKPGAVIAEPDIQMIKVKKGDFIILACDGLWDVIDNEGAINFVTPEFNALFDQLREKFRIDVIPAREATTHGGNNANLELIALGLANRAYTRKSTDNISVMLIKIDE